MLGEVGPGRLQVTELARFRNGPVRLPDGLYWDVLGLWQDVLGGLRAARGRDDLLGVAVDSWAVDYGLLDSRGALLANPMHYRDERTAAGVAAVATRIGADELYEVNGLQRLPLNTVYQLAADTRLAQADRLLLVPDLLGYWLTGVAVTERTNASTTGLLDVHTGEWSAPLLDRLGLDPGLLTGLVDPGTVLGGLTHAVRADTGLGAAVTVSTVGSHDTASAVVGVPAEEPGFGYVACGTWGLVGVELERPVVTAAGATANFTNERGVDGTVRYLRNVMGLWLLQESLREWEVRGPAVDLATVLAEAAALPPGGPTVDADTGAFLAPGDMPARIAAACRERDQPVPAGQAAVVRCIVDSLAAAFARGLHDAERLSGTALSVVHLVGGGARNPLLCQLTADATGLPVVAGPVEATALGNLVVQARTLGVLAGDRWALRALVRSTQTVTTFQPRTTRPTTARPTTARATAKGPR